MGKFSTYRYLLLKDDTSAPHINVRSRTIKQPKRLKKVFIFLIFLALLVTYFLGQAQWLDGLAKTLGYESVYHHAVIIDAGSSGTRVLAYKFRVPFTVFSSVSLELVEEYFEQSKPGLSSYADDPVKGADTIVQLIKKAEFLTPLEKRKETPLLVRATAGLRLLPADTAQQLIAHVAAAIAELGYSVGPHSVEIMDGSDEGIFIWYTVNLLHNLIGDETMAALDLGGGSTQVTYQLSERDAAAYPVGDVYRVPAGDNVTLYTHSYLNLGLLAARFGIFSLEAGGAREHFSSACVEPIVQREPWTYGNKQYFISGKPRAAGLKRADAFAQCYDTVKRYVSRTLGEPPPRVPSAHVAAMSYFYDVAADAGIIDVMRGGTVTVGQYRAAGLRACSASNVEQPWACLDLSCALSLLHDAYGIQDHEQISLFKKINGHEVSWALGLAYTTVMNKISAKP